MIKRCQLFSSFSNDPNYAGSIEWLKLLSSSVTPVDKIILDLSIASIEVINNR
jgi:hypothetical protein